MDQATGSLHASMAQIMAEVKGLTTRVTSLSERDGECGEKLNQLLTRIGGIETRLNELEGAVGEGVGAHHGRNRLFRIFSLSGSELVSEMTSRSARWVGVCTAEA
jgi:hypothetical protein